MHSEDHLFNAICKCYTGYRLWILIDPKANNFIHNLAQNIINKNIFKNKNKCINYIQHKNTWIKINELIKNKKIKDYIYFIIQKPMDVVIVRNNQMHQGIWLTNGYSSSMNFAILSNINWGILLNRTFDCLYKLSKCYFNDKCNQYYIDLDIFSKRLKNKELIYLYNDNIHTTTGVIHELTLNKNKSYRLKKHIIVLFDYDKTKRLGHKWEYYAYN